MLFSLEASNYSRRSRRRGQFSLNGNLSSISRIVPNMKPTAVGVSFCVWICLLSSSLASEGHYCERNVTTSILVPVTKQRTFVKQPPKWKVWKKAQYFTETYNTQEEQISYKLVSECCPGYVQDPSGLCEPVCDRGCPAYASCVEPQRCQCSAGYVSAVAHRDGTHYCEPICEHGCPSGTQCVAPKTCTCKEGYKALPPTGDGVSTPCVPSCQLGDVCANGHCIDVERCVCNRGYSWSFDTHSCIEGTEKVSEDEVLEPEDSSSSSMTTVVTGATTGQCEGGFVYYAGECRADIFESNEFAVNDCRQADCGAHQTCNLNGSCVCNAGFIEEQQQLPTITLSCRPVLMEELLSVEEATDGEDKVNGMTISIVAVATGLLFVVIVVALIAGLRRRGNQQENEMPKEPGLKCEFSQKTYDVDEWLP